MNKNELRLLRHSIAAAKQEVLNMSAFIKMTKRQQDSYERRRELARKRLAKLKAKLPSSK